jgi:DNA replication and repair protein RecF
MIVQQLALQTFRTYAAQYFKLGSGTTIIVGPNAVGKTTIIEALHLLSTGHSFRAHKIEEMVQLGQELARVKVSLDDETILEMLLTRGEVQGKKSKATYYLVNGVKKTRKSLVGKLVSVVFRPEDMRLVEGSPSRRREFLDEVISQVDYNYVLALKTYNQALVRCNKVVEKIREGEMPAAALQYWEMQLVKHGTYLQQRRREFTAETAAVEFALPLSLEYLASVISEERADQYRQRSIAAGHWLIGPHKDDIDVQLPFTLDGQRHSLATYGSRGQQRLGVLWLKMCALQYLQNRNNQPPLLLLDDIMSELDETSRSHVLSLLKGRQAVVTTTDHHLIAEIEQVVENVSTLDLEKEKK